MNATPSTPSSIVFNPSPTQTLPWGVAIAGGAVAGSFRVSLSNVSASAFGILQPTTPGSSIVSAPTSKTIAELGVQSTNPPVGTGSTLQAAINAAILAALGGALAAGKDPEIEFQDQGLMDAILAAVVLWRNLGNPDQATWPAWDDLGGA